MEIKINNLKDINLAARTFIDNMGKGRVFAFTENGRRQDNIHQGRMRKSGRNRRHNITYVRHRQRIHVRNIRRHYLPFDFYRIKKIEEVYDMGYEEYFYSGSLCFIEWPELIEGLLPDDATKVTIEEDGDGSRTVRF